MKLTLIIVSVIVIAIVLLFFFKAIASKSEQALGLNDNGQLFLCPKKHNCVCSEETPQSPYFIEPISFLESEKSNTLTLLKNSIVELGGKLVVEKEGYLAYEFTSSIFRFIDDLEVRVEQGENVIHIRSASRVGESDFGVNLKRVNDIKKRLQEKQN